MKYLIVSLLASTLLNCNTKENSPQTPEKIFGSFMLALGEGVNNKVQCVASFKKGDEDGDEFYLGNSFELFVDSFRLTFDSVYVAQYDTEIDTSHFIGSHTWYINSPDKKYSYKCLSKPFVIASEIPKEVGKENIQITCKELQPDDKVTMLISGDYSDSSETIIELPADNGFFNIPTSTWERVSGTNLTMHFNLSSISQIPPDQFLTAGGTLETTRVTGSFGFKVIR